MSEPRELLIGPAAGADEASPRRLLREFASYADAERMVDALSDNGFAVQHLTIVGDRLRSVEHVTARVTRVRAAVSGLATGAWCGAGAGLLLGLFATDAAWLAVMLGSTGVGATFGAVFGFVNHWLSGGHHDFASAKAVEAGSYSVQVDTEHAPAARRLLAAAPTWVSGGQAGAAAGALRDPGSVD